jgi:hypothetical protein
MSLHYVLHYPATLLPALMAELIALDADTLIFQL